jgi:hypothetical protein
MQQRAPRSNRLMTSLTKTVGRRLTLPASDIADEIRCRSELQETSRLALPRLRHQHPRKDLPISRHGSGCQRLICTKKSGEAGGLMSYKLDRRCSDNPIRTAIADAAAPRLFVADIIVPVAAEVVLNQSLVTLIVIMYNRDRRWRASSNRRRLPVLALFAWDG